MLGSAIAAALRACCHHVRALVRPTSLRTNLVSGDSLYEGDLRDRASLAKGLKGVRFLFHPGAEYRLWARSSEEIIRNNAEGTRFLVEEALSAGAERIVYTSSVATLKLVDGVVATEDYVAAGHVAALERGRIGERYVLGGENVFLADMLAGIARLVGRRPRKIPRAAVYPIAYAAKMMATIRGVEPLVTLDGLSMSRHHMFFDEFKARRELGYMSRPYREGLSDAITWFRAHGRLK